MVRNFNIGSGDPRQPTRVWRIRGERPERIAITMPMATANGKCDDEAILQPPWVQVCKSNAAGYPQSHSRDANSISYEVIFIADARRTVHPV